MVKEVEKLLVEAVAGALDRIEPLESNIERILDGMADFENRISFLENSQSYDSEKPKEVLPKIPPEHRLFDRLQQLEGRFIHLENKYNEHMDITKKKVTNKYKYK